MPGRDYTRAYKLLEQSIVGYDPSADADTVYGGVNGDGNEQRAYDGNEYTHDTTYDSGRSSAGASIGLAPLDIHNRSHASSLRLLTPPQINGYENGLSHTPLSHSDSSTISGSHVVNGTTSVHQQSLAVATPPNQQDPLTPDLTPPSRLELQPPPSIRLGTSTSRLTSPVAESFQTAREEIASNTTGTPHPLAESTVLGESDDTLPGVGKIERLSLDDTGLGLRLASDEAEATPRAPRTTARKARPFSFESGYTEFEWEEGGSSNMSSIATTTTQESGVFRNVSVRKTRKLYEGSDVRTSIVTQNDGEVSPAPLSAGQDGASESPVAHEGHTVNESPVDDARDATAVPLSTKATPTLSSLEATPVLPSAETTPVMQPSDHPRKSPVVQPPVATNLTNGRKDRDFTWPAAVKPKAHYQVRELSEERTRSNSRTPPFVQAMVFDSPPVRTRRLRHVSNCSSLRDEVATRPDRSARNSFGSDKSPPPPLHHMKKQIPDKRDRRPDKESKPSPNSSPRSLRRRRDSIPSRPSTAPDQPKDAVIPEELSGLNIPRADTSAHVSRVAEAPHQAARQATSRLMATTPDMIDNAVSKALHTKPPSSQTPIVTERFYQPLAGEESALGTGKSLTPERQLLSPPNLSHFGHAQRLSVGQTTIGSSQGRPSLDQDKSGLSSPMYFHLGSFASLQSGTPELIEANAVNLYSHNNGSVHVVQHTPPASRSLALPSDSSSTPQQAKPLLALQPATPTFARPPIDSVDSPLRNPRPAPELPTLAVVPPTPVRGPGDPAQRPSDEAGLQRSNSFLQRARRYSGTLTSSLRRSVSGRQPSGASTPNRLHPFRLPRHPWSDSSDSDDEPDTYHPPFARGPPTTTSTTPAKNPTTRPHPPNAPNAPTPTHPTRKPTRGSSLKGFLIGNSLGIQRGPTNKRRPVIVLPSKSPPKSPKPTTVRSSARRSRARPDAHTGSKAAVTGPLSRLKRSLRAMGARRRARERERARQEIRDSIGPSWYVESGGTGGRVRED